MNFTAQSALVIGGSGFLGSGIVGELLASGFSVITLGRRNRPADPRVSSLTADRSRPGELARAIGERDFDLVVDCAAFDGPQVADAVAAFRHRVGHYVFISTDFVYARTTNARYPLREDAPEQPALPYAGGKLAGESVLAEAWEKNGFPATTLRPPHILGAGKPLGCDPLAMREVTLPETIRGGVPLRLLAEGQLLIQPVWNREVGRAIVSISGNSRTFGGVFNCAGADAIPAMRYYQIIAEAIGVPLRWETVSLDSFITSHPEKAHMARHRVYDMTGLLAATGYRPTLPVEAAILDTLKWAESVSK